MPSAITQPLSLPAPSIDQLRSVFVGRVSLTVTLVADPVPEFVTVIRNEIGSPALTGEAPSVFVIVRFGHATVMLTTGVETLAAFAAEPLAELEKVPHVAAVVGDVMCTCREAAAARLPKLQLRIPAAIEQPESLPPASIDQLRP